MKNINYKNNIKPVLDFIFALLFVLMLSPLMILTAIIVRLSLGSPVFFTHERPGYQSRLFRLIKFRTMLEKYDDRGNLLPDAQRLTRFGKFLRSTSLDELPELFNVLKGDMSIVGPRPLLREYLPLYSKEQARRHEVKPGMTGWAQINGRNALTWGQKFEHDIWYVEHLSFLLDIKIMCLTIIRIFQRQGISHQGHVTMEKFKGNL